MAIIGYARVSTCGQSLDTQLNALQDCEKVFKEIISGAKDDHPELTAMLEYVRDGDTVKVTKLDRLARNTKHLQEISEYLDAKTCPTTDNEPRDRYRNTYGQTYANHDRCNCNLRT